MASSGLCLTPRAAIAAAERLAQARDVNRQDALFDEGVGPHLRQQLLFRQQPAGLTHERHEQIVRFRREMDRPVPARQRSAGRIERELAERVDLGGGHDSANLSKCLRTTVPRGVYAGRR